MLYKITRDGHEVTLRTARPQAAVSRWLGLGPALRREHTLSASRDGGETWRACVVDITPAGKDCHATISDGDETGPDLVWQGWIFGK